jgi:putative ABC transport system substrate-binding protein
MIRRRDFIAGIGGASRHTRRREFIAGLGSAAACPLAAGAQQPAVPAIGFLSSGFTVRLPNSGISAVFQGLGEMGYVEGRNVAVEYRGADQYDQLAGVPTVNPKRLSITVG